METNSLQLTDKSSPSLSGVGFYSLEQTLNFPWILEQIYGHRVAVIGCSDISLLVGLMKKGFQVMAYDDPSSVERILVQHQNMLPSLREVLYQVDFSQRDSFRENGFSKPADTVIINGLPGNGVKLEAIIEFICGPLGKKGGRLIVVLPEVFTAQQHHPSGFHLISFLASLRQRVVPEHLSVENEELRFVGQLTDLSADHWHCFEFKVWSDLMDGILRPIQVRHRRKLSDLQQYFHRLRFSISYLVGNALVVAVKKPRTLCWLPARLWHIYRSIDLHNNQKPTIQSLERGPETVTFPKWEWPPPQRTEASVVAVILDKFSEFCWGYEANLIGLTPRGWQRELEQSQPAFLLVESAWAGNNGAWRGMIANDSEQEWNPLGDLIQYCREHNISTVFWNREDPLNFDFFIDAAKKFDIVFTSDANSISRYKKLCGHDHIYAMGFAAQPRLHNPCRGPSWPRHAVYFPRSGINGHQDPVESLPSLIDPALCFDLHIFDCYLNRTDLKSSSLPDRYQAAIRGSLSDEEMLTAYRCYDVMLNANSVTESPTMFPRRVLESLACGTPVVSTDSVGMSQMLGHHVSVTRCAKETADHLGALLSHEEMRRREGHLAYRYVHEHHTYRHRMDEMLKKIGLKPRSRSTRL